MMANDPRTDRMLIQAAERQQRQIGHELHETLCQTLAGVSIYVDLLARQRSAGKEIENDSLAQLSQHLQRGIDQARGIYRKFDPVALAGGGLFLALDTLAGVTATVLPCEFRCEKPVFMRNKKGALAMYRIAQEAVRNAVQHSHADRIVISLRERGQNAIVVIKDNGRGFQLPVERPSVTGIAVMESYARDASAILRIVSRRNGTSVTCQCRNKKP